MKKILIAITGPSTCGKNVLSETFLSDGFKEGAILSIPLITSRPRREDDDERFTRNLSEQKFAESGFFIRHGKYGIAYQDMISFATSDAEIGVVIVGAVEMGKLNNAVTTFSYREGFDIGVNKVLMLFSKEDQKNYAVSDTRMGQFFSGLELTSRISVNKTLLREHFLQETFRSEMDQIFYAEDRKLPSENAQEILEKLSLSSLIVDEEKVLAASQEIINKRKPKMKNIYYPSYGGSFRAFVTSGSDILFDDNSFSELEKEYIVQNPNASVEIVSDVSKLPDSFKISPYAFDGQTCSFIGKCLEAGKDVFFGEKKLQESDLIILEKAHDNIGRKDSFYEMAFEILPDAMPDRNKTIFSDFNEFKRGINDVVESEGYPIIIKSSNGKGGKGCLVCRDGEDLKLATQIIGHDIFSEKSEYGEDSRSLPFIVEKFLENASSYNISFFVGENGMDEREAVLMSKQIITNDTIYGGNESHDLSDSSAATAKEYAQKLGAEFAKTGLRGWVGIDFVRDAEGEIKLIEANPRINGNTHAVRFLKEKGQSEFIMPIMEWDGEGNFNPDSVNQILGEKSNGAFPYNLNRNNSLLYMFHGDTKEEATQLVSLLTNTGQFKVKQQAPREIRLEDGSTKTLVGNYAYFYDLMHSLELENKSEISKTSPNNTSYVVVSTEDDKYRVAGGIGTYTGILTKELARRNVNTTWITQSPDKNEFTENTEGVQRVYLSRYDDEGNYMNLSKFSEKVSGTVKKCVDKLLTNPEAQVCVESPEWEGLLSQYFLATRNPRVTKISRTHTPLVHTGAFNNIPDSQEVNQQLDKEERQLANSNIISSPTKYMLEAINGYFPKLGYAHKNGSQKQVVIPNCINIDDFANYQYPSRDTSIETLRQLVGADISADNFNLFALGSVEKRKGVDDVLMAFNDLAKERPNAHLYLLGHYNKDGDNLTENPKYTRNDVLEKIDPSLQDRVHVLGYVDHEKLREVIKAGDGYVFAYLADNFPGSLAEVGLSETPIVAVARGGISEMVKDAQGKELCPLVSGGNSKELSTALSEMIDGKASGKTSPQELKASLMEKYDVSQTVDQMLEQYSAVNSVGKNAVSSRV